jgi:hypothetical protein
MAKRPIVTARPGFEPARGFPDPSAAQGTTSFGFTHFPNRDRSVCGQVLTNAADYDDVAPTCPRCAAWLADVKRTTAAKDPEAAAELLGRPAQPPQPGAAPAITNSGELPPGRAS